LLLYTSHLALGVSLLAGHFYFINSAPSSFSGAVAEEEEDFCKGSFRTHILYFVLNFALLYFYVHHFIKNLKKIESLVVVISLLLVHYVVP
jgi:hypothetical protein